MPLKAFADQIGAPILGVSAYPIFIINWLILNTAFAFHLRFSGCQKYVTLTYRKNGCS